MNKLAAGCRHTVLIQPDHTVYAVGDNKLGQCNTASWQHIIELAAGNVHSAHNTYTSA